MFESEKLKSMGDKFFGVYRAIVKRYTDPELLGRITVICPSVYGEDVESPWCYPAFPMASDKYGMRIVPYPGDYVWLMFEKGLADNPIWIGSPYTKSAPDIFTKMKDGKDRIIPSCYGFVTPQGNSVIIDDAYNEMHFEHKTGAMIDIDSGGNIIVKPAPGKDLKLG